MMLPAFFRPTCRLVRAVTVQPSPMDATSKPVMFTPPPPPPPATDVGAVEGVAGALAGFVRRGSCNRAAARRFVIHTRQGVALAVLLSLGHAVLTQNSYTLPLVLPTSGAGLEGFVRSGTVGIRTVDDDGNRFGPVSLAPDAKESVNLSSRDLRVEMHAEVGRAGEGRGVALHPGQHLVHLADLPAPLREAPVGEQRVGLVEDEEGAAVARLRERGGDQLLGLPDILRHQTKTENEQ